MAKAMAFRIGNKVVKKNILNSKYFKRVSLKKKGESVKFKGVDRISNYFVFGEYSVKPRGFIDEYNIGFYGNGNGLFFGIKLDRANKYSFGAHSSRLMSESQSGKAFGRAVELYFNTGNGQPLANIVDTWSGVRVGDPLSTFVLFSSDARQYESFFA